MNNLFIRLIAILNKAVSKTRIRQDIKQIEQSPFYVKLVASLNKTTSRSRIKQDLKQISQNQTVKFKGQIDNKSLQNSMKTARQQIESSSRSRPVNISSRFDMNANRLNEVNQAQEDIVSSGKGIKDVVQYYVNWQKILDLIVQSARKAVDTSVELAKAQTNLQIVTGKSNEQMQLLMREYNKLALELSSTTIDTANAADQWLRQGKSVAETNELIKDSVIFSKIAQLEASDATKYLTSGMNGYKVATKDVIGIVDKLSAVDLASATSAGGLAESMSKCSNSAQIAGVSMDNLIGYIATVTDVTQKSASVVGESFKTIFSRMGKVSIGDFIDDDGTDMTEQINQVEGILGKFDIKLRDSADEFRAFENVIYDVGMAWDNFTSVEKNAIAAGFGGVYQRENVLTLFENFDKAMKLSEVSANSAGTAYQKFATYENGLEAATNRLTASFESLAYNTVNSDFMIGLADGAAAIVEFVDKTKLIQTGLTALTFTGIIKGLLLFSTKMVAAKNNMNAMTTAMNLSTQATQRNRAENILLGQSYSKLTPAQQRLLLSNKKLNMEQKIAILRASGLTRAQAKAKLQAMGLATATGEAANATFSLRGAWETLKLSIASNPIGFIVTALTSATMIISNVNEKQKELSEAAKEATVSFKNEKSTLMSLKEEYLDIIKNTENESEKSQKLIEWKKKLVEQYGFEKDAIAKVNQERQTGLDLFNNETRNNASEAWAAAREEFYKAENELNHIMIEDYTTSTGFGISQENIDKVNEYGVSLREVSDIFDAIEGHQRYEFQVPDSLEDSKLSLANAISYYDGLTKRSTEENKILSALQSLYNKVLAKEAEFGETYSNGLEILATNTMYSFAVGINAVSNVTEETYSAWKEGLLAMAGESEPLRKALAKIADETFPQFNNSVDDTAKEVKSNGVPSVQKLTDAYDDLAEKIKEILDLQDKLSSAFEKVASGEVFSAKEAYKLLEQFPELYKSVTAVDGGFTFPLDALENAYRQQNEELLKQIEENSKENQEVIDYYNEQKKKIDGLQNNATNSGGLQGFNALEADTKINGLSEELPTLKENAEEAQKLIDENTVKTDVLNSSLDTHSKILEGINTQYDKGKDKIDEYNSHISTIDKAISSLNEGNALTYDEMVALVEISPALNNAFTKQGDGYSIAIDCLTELREESYTTRNSYIDDLIAMAEATKRELGSKINSYYSYISYMPEINAWQEFIDKLNALKKDVNEPDSSSSSGKDTLSEQLQQEIDYYDKIIQGIEAVADERIEAIDKEIEAIEKQKDALKEQNDERQRELDLIEAQNNLEKAKKQKVFVYKEGLGLVQVQDEKAVKDAQKELDDVQREIKEAEYDKQIDFLEQQSKATEEYKDTFSDMKSDIEDAISVEQAKAALDTDEKGLLGLDKNAIDGIQDGLAKAVVEKDKHDNKDNPFYQNVTWETLMKKLGSNATMEEFRAKVYEPMMSSFSPDKQYNVQSGNNTQYITNNSPTTFTATFNISEATDANEVANVVRTEITDLLQKTYNKIK